MSTGNNSKPSYHLARVGEGEALYKQTEIVILDSGAPGGAMSRRDFLGTSITAAAAMAFLGGCGRDEKPAMETIIAETESLIGAKALVLGAHKDSIHSINISPAGNLLVSRSGDNTIKLWNLHERALIKTMLHKYAYPGCINPDGKLLVLGSLGKTIELWSLPDGNMTNTLTGHISNVSSVCISPDGNLLASGSYDGAIKLWSLPGGDLIKTLAGHTDRITSICISPDGKLLASGSKDKSMKLWSLPDGKLLKTSRRSSDYIHAYIGLDISSDGNVLVSRGWDQHIRLWSLPDGKLGKTLKRNEDSVASIAISPDGKLLASGNNQRESGIQLWSLPDGKPVKTLNVKTPFGGFNPSRISPDGKWLVFLDDSPNIRLLSLPDASLLKTLAGHTDRVSSVCISPDGKLLASGSLDKTVRLWSLPDGEFISCLADLADNHESVKGTVFSVTNENGRTVTYTLPCGAAIPAGAACSCNCVPGSIKPPAPAQSVAPGSGSSGGGGGCRHGTRCVCMAVRCRRT